MAQKHGIFIYEEATAIAIPQVAHAGLEVIIGTAPINMVDDPESLVNVPILATKATEAMATLGYVRDFENYTLCQSMYITSNLYQVTPVIYINVLDPKKHRKNLNPTTVAVDDLEAVVPLTGILREGLKVSTVGNITTYTVAAPVSGDNPSTKKWYILKNATYAAATETAMKEGVIYYRQNFVEELDVEGSPLEQGLYEIIGRKYVLTNDTFPNPGKSYYSVEYLIAETPDGSNPAYEGWFVLTSGDFVASTDTTVVNGKIYYIKTTTSGDVTLEENVDYTLTFDTDGHLVVTLIMGSRYADSYFIVVEGKMLDPTMVTKWDIIGAVNVNTGAETGMEVIRKVYPELGVVPGILIAPGWSHIAEVGIALQAKAVNINGVFKAMAYLDLPTEGDVAARKYTDCKKVKELMGYTSEFAVNLWPMVRVGELVFYYSAVAAACTAYTDALHEDIPSVSPSNKRLAITGVCLKDETEITLDQDQGTTVNEYGVCTALNINGFKMWGNHTGAWPASGDAKDVWIPVRRMFNWQGNTFILTYFYKVDDPMNRKLIETIIDSENIRCAAYAPEHWAGAKIEYLPDDNPITDILAGRMTFRQHIAPYTPAETINNILNYDLDILQTALYGEEE